MTFAYGTHVLLECAGVEVAFMAAPVDSITIPVLSASVWWAVRDRFKQAVPTTVTASYLGSILNQKESSVVHVNRNLRLLGLLDEEGRPTDRAYDWRMDQSYGDACRAMWEAAYPTELRELAPAPDPDYETVKNWFVRATKAGEGTAKNRAQTYMLVASGDLSKRLEPKPRGTSSEATTTASQRKKPAAPQQKSSPEGMTRRKPATDENSVDMLTPRLQIAVQVNIDPALTPDQIDQVFRSMAAHLYGNSQEN